jgi:DNA polymerase
MIIGEGPGLHEDEEGIPFVGPAGQLMDQIFLSVGWDTNTDFYLGNVIKCRPIAEPGSGKQNNTPLAAQRRACMPYIRQEIAIVKPKIIVLLGASAVKAILGTNKTMGELAGKVYCSDQYPNIVFFVMYHPAALLHSKKKGDDEYQRLRRLMWDHIQQLKQIDEELQ